MGGPLPKGHCLAEYGSYAELAAATLKKLGLDEDKIRAVPVCGVKKDRTYASAMALKKWLLDSGLNVKAINIISHGCHARRTWLLFEKAFDEDKVEVGIITEPNRNYDPKRWWTSSEGVRTVIGQAIAYIYARVFFYPDG